MLLSAATPMIMEKLGSSLGERPDALQKGLGAALPAILGALIGKGSNAEGAGALIKTITDNKIDAGMLDNLGDLLGGGEKSASLGQMGGAILASLLGDKAGGVANVIAGLSGLKGESAKGLLGMAAPLVLGGLMKQAPAGGFSPAGLIDLLGSQKDHVAKMMPAGLSDLVGFAAPAPAAAPVPPPPAEPEQKTGMMPWLIGLAVLALLAFLGFRGCAPGVENQASAPPAVEAPAAPERLSIELPGGISLDVLKGSIGDQLAQFLRSTDAAPKTFTFDNLNFDTGGTALTAESGATVDAIVQILKAYPKAAVRLDGYTDNVGDPASNLTLSQARAETVAKMMIEKGVAANRIASAGYGQDSPKGDNTTEEGRAQNRRIELTVTAK
jgi:outer membrane protein OmpA-like peptidoglycan-associated protein